MSQECSNQQASLVQIEAKFSHECNEARTFRGRLIAAQNEGMQVHQAGDEEAAKVASLRTELEMPESMRKPESETSKLRMLWNERFWITRSIPS